MKINKKGSDLPPSILVVIVFSIVAGIIILLAVVLPVFSTGSSAFADEACRFNVVLKQRLTIFGVTHVFPLLLCGESKVTIKGDDWGKCNEDYKKDYENAEKDDDKKAALKSCAAWQIAKYAGRCWYRFLGGNSNVGSYTCYSVRVRNIANQDISQNDVKNAIGKGASPLLRDKNMIDFDYLEIPSTTELSFNDFVKIIYNDDIGNLNSICFNKCSTPEN